MFRLQKEIGNNHYPPKKEGNLLTGHCADPEAARLIRFPDEVVQLTPSIRKFELLLLQEVGAKQC